MSGASKAAIALVDVRGLVASFETVGRMMVLLQRAETNVEPEIVGWIGGELQNLAELVRCELEKVESVMGGSS